jgi:hypothetical protein
VTIEDLFSRLTTALDRAEVPYMVTGSYASSIHSVPRATRDIDIIIFPTREQLTSYYAELDAALDALRRRSQFNVVDFATGWKVDFIIPPFTEFSEEEFERRRIVELSGTSLFVVSPEDIVIAKLRWAKAGSSDRQIEDAASVIAFQGEDLDRVYVERWVRKLELDDQWRAAKAKAGEQRL